MTDTGIGIPADVLRQRPDVRAAERALAAASAALIDPTGAALVRSLPSRNFA